MGVTLRNPLDLRDLQQRLKDAARGKFIPELGRRVAAALMKEVADEFRHSRNPYGKPWAPLARERARNLRANRRRAAKGKPPRRSKPLIDTGRMRGSVIARAVGSEVRVSIPVDYASYHQYGTRTIPQRQMLPEASTGGLGPRWTLAIRKETEAVLQKQLEDY